MALRFGYQVAGNSDTMSFSKLSNIQTFYLVATVSVDNCFFVVCDELISCAESQTNFRVWRFSS